ncbi:hypothetical protein CANTEDRAFT_114861 [Yamadazyma tenuis ATCC 10573]|uniref:Copper-fist-domain-containing protein n=1 Tax=Candida tenuis (strain ATCC 10573 / BCRC 21748 / CBS 615 / JCM 9827 / NBRC 10315 / NRRL Y-1498 / VKM Y-70) TaxID=590646 RepID=G3BA91_CANTC|nr:copper-fist-domain-containing protein [Yamadazyma tenuis ATCC 10573]XP_006688677.1 uncharacterized protein CANTEDRAFT_114861 [Yamadazyma tenuis ATCC 10573]EGV62506.1 copper-fist-domain-containing protein [Yamadazyma tenuis ATCC 10573]EGV62507.1 hypothetical protein CANTEDRAFT_114861 [Yamadazyma tenuis ATCC 10573]
MIVKEEFKYSCIECIRGHRSSLCKHSERPLLQVRSKGRPTISNNPNYRIAIFAKHVEPEGKAIRIIQSSIEYIIDITTRDIIGPYTEESQIKVTQHEVNSDSFIVATSCCSNGLVRNRSCGCNHTNNKSKILKKYLNKNKKKFKFIDNNHEAKQESLRDQLRRSVRASQSAVAPCFCGDDCQCESCAVHHGENYDFDIRSELDTAIREMGLGTSFVSTPASTADSSVPALAVSDFNLMTYNYQPVQAQSSAVARASSPTDSSPVECRCPDNDCKCSNCETHGIINGIKLDDIFANIDYRLLGI